MNKHTVIINPKSGNFFQRKKTKKLIKKITQGLKADVITTQSKDHAKEVVQRKYKYGCRSFLIFGGDGTIFDIVNALYPKALKDPPTFALFPTGTGNSMVRDFSNSAEDTLGCVFEDKTRACDVFKLQNQEDEIYFTNLASFGFVAKVAKMRNSYFSWMGPFGYILAVLFTLPFFRSEHYPIIIDGDRIESKWTFISCNNTRFTGGNMMMAPHALPNDGKIGLILVQAQNKLRLLQAFPKIFKGTHINLDFVTTQQPSMIEFELPTKQPIMIDGELIEKTPESISVHPDALRVYAP